MCYSALYYELYLFLYLVCVHDKVESTEEKFVVCYALIVLSLDKNVFAYCHVMHFFYE